MKKGTWSGHHREWTQAELDRLLELRADGLNFCQIGVRLKRNRSSVQKKLIALGAGGPCRPKPRPAATGLPVAESDWMQPLTRARLMAGRA